MKHLFTFLLLVCFISCVCGQYRVYESAHNEINQTVIRTRDGGLLIGSVQFCYTPKEWVIEGCPVGIRLIKTNSEGDTVWTREISNDDIQGYLHLFERSDGGYTLITAQDATYVCDGWVIDPALGLLQVLSYTISETGEVVDQFSFPDNCNLQLLNALAVTDTSYAVLARYTEPFASDTVEGHLFIIDFERKILQSRIFENEPMYKADIMTDSLGHILLFFMDHDSLARLQVYDRTLQILEDHINPEINAACLAAEEMRGTAVLSDSGVLYVICDNLFGKAENLEISTFNRNFQLLAQRRYTLPMASDFAINEDNELIVLSQHTTKEDSSEIRLTYFNGLADSILTRQYRIQGNQSPASILPLDGEEFAIVGGHNCCNLSLADGPGKTFLYVGALSTYQVETHPTSSIIHFYPNPGDDQLTLAITAGYDTTVDYRFSIYTATGTILKSGNTENNTIPIALLPDGMYFVSLSSEAGEIMVGSFMKVNY